LPQAAEASQTSAIVDEIERQIDRATEPCDTDEAIEAYIVRECRGSDDEDDDAMEQEEEEPEPEEVPPTASEAAKALTNSVSFFATTLIPWSLLMRVQNTVVQLGASPCLLLFGINH